jgi:glycosyltransferase involved in cell wall biosynthesis
MAAMTLLRMSPSEAVTLMKPGDGSSSLVSDPTRVHTGAGHRLRFLVFAYACEPGKGSEPEAGWIWSRMLARLGETWVLTRRNNRETIEAQVSQLPERDNLRFVYVDLPAWSRFWKRRDRGARLYYLLWQVAALGRAKKLIGQVHFDLVWHLTWANAWIGSFAALLSKPFVYGPVGGGIGMDLSFASMLGVRGTLYELVRGVARSVARYANPIARLAWRRADLVLVQNRETMTWLPGRHRGKVVVFPNVVLDRDSVPGGRSRSQPPYTALFAGRLVPLKGVGIALRALAFLPEWRLTICGKGPDEKRLMHLAWRLGVEDRVEFLGWVPRREVHSRMRGADVFVFPSLHDEGGYVVAEALSEGLPVVCLARGGPPLIGGIAVVPTTVSETASALASTMREAAGTATRPFPQLDARTEDLRLLLGQRLSHAGLADAMAFNENVIASERRKGLR